MASVEPQIERPPMSLWRRHRGLLVVALVAVLAFYTRSWEGDLHGDPVHYGAIAKSILSSGDWLTMHDGPGLLYARKPPLMFWLVAVNFRLFGAGTYAAKFWSSAFAVGVCLLTYLTGRRLFGETAGLLAGCMAATFPGVVPNAIDLRLDSAVAFFTVLSVYAVVRAEQEERPAYLLLVGAAAGLGMMTKPSAALHVGVLSVLLLAVRRPRLLLSPYVPGAVALAVAIGAPWHVLMVARHGRAFTDSYFGEQIAGRMQAGGQFFANAAGYLAVMSARALPWWPFGAYALLRRQHAEPAERRGMALSVLWFLAILALMSVPPKTYDRYMIPAYPAVALLAGSGLARLLPGRWHPRVPAVAAAYAVTLTCLLAIVPLEIHSYRCKGFVEARPMLDRLSPGATIAAFEPKDPPGPAVLPQQWGLRSRCIYYLDRTFVNYPTPEAVAASGERFVIVRRDNLGALTEVGYEPLRKLSDRFWLAGRAAAGRGVARAGPVLPFRRGG